MTDPNAPAPVADPALALRARLLDLSAWLKGARAQLDEHRRSMDAFARYVEHSARANALGSLLEIVERSCDFLVREVARAGQELAADAFRDALLVCPPIALDPPTTSGDAGATT